MDKVIVGCDTETVNGHANCITIYSEDQPIEDIIFCDETNVTKRFLKYLSKLPQNREYIFYIHNLAGFDMAVLFEGYHEYLIENKGEFSFSIDGWTIRGLYGTPSTCTLRKGSHLGVQLIDSLSFFRGSLEAASKLYCSNLPKLRKPLELGARRYTAKDGDFIRYAMRDSQVAFHIGKAIEELHREFDIRQCISNAQLSERIFRHRFLTYNIPQPSIDIIHASLATYHGGKNNLAGTKRTWFRGVSSIDISSAYPDAMRSLPAFSNSKLYKTYRGTSRVKRVPEYGVYCISGTVDDCQWPCLFNHAFKPLRGSFENIWVQGIEVNEALRSGELHLSRIRGYWYDAEKDHQAPALRAFCEHFYKLKEAEKNPVKRAGYKEILNSLYGKFIQTRKHGTESVWDIESEKSITIADLQAGGMFHPFIASAITAHTRARIHRLEHKYKALHTATDGIFTQARVFVGRGDDRVLATAKRLGDLTLEAKGDLYIHRNKCYILYGDKPTKKSFKSPLMKGKHVLKWARHGFHGKIRDFEKIIITGDRKYWVSAPDRLKQTLKHNKSVDKYNATPKGKKKPKEYRTVNNFRKRVMVLGD